MPSNKPYSTYPEFFERLNENEKIITEVLRDIIHETLLPHCKEKISYGVPYFYGNKGVCILWPASIPRGGVKEGVLFGIWYGNRLTKNISYLDKGSNKQIFYKIFKTPDEINIKKVKSVLQEALGVDKAWEKK